MKVAISGSTGLIGSAVAQHLAAAGHEAARLVRPGRALGPGAVRWDPATGDLDAAAWPGCDSVIHLGGENIAGRWTAAKRARIHSSRVGPTDQLCRALAALPTPPRSLLCASAVGYYGSRGEEALDEDAPPGDGFLADVCRQWEAACQPAVDAGIRVVHLRFAMVLSPAGGALKRMLLPFRLGVGGRIGNGRQVWSWIALPDAAAAIAFALDDESLSGPINVVSPNAVTNRQFTADLGRALRRPTLCPMPAPVARLLFGRMADELLLASARAGPGRLLAHGFEFRFPQLLPALRHLLSGDPA